MEIMDNKKQIGLRSVLVWMIWIFSGFFLLWLLLPSSLRSQAYVTDSDINQTKGELNSLKEQIGALNETLGNTQSNLTDAIAQRSSLEQKLAFLQLKETKAKELLAQYDVRLEEKQQTLASMEALSASTYESFLHWLRLTYENGNVNYLAVLFSSQNLSEFLAESERISQLITYETRTMETLSEQLSAIEAEKKSLEQERTEADQVATELLADQKNYAELLSQQEELVKKLQADEQKQLELLEHYQQQRDALNNKLTVLIQQWKEQNKNYAGDAMVWPTLKNLNQVSSKFGWRTYQIYGKWKTDFHNGIDIQMATGTPIYAANAGKVMIAEYHPSYGWYVMIDHGGGIQTLYAHMSSLAVTKGQTLQKGASLGYSGATGDVTGPHLHFEVWSGGVRVNPLSYVTVP